jgi:hypothetical protein
MNEVLKQAYQLLLTEPHAPTVCDQLEVIFRQAIAELESQEPVAWVDLQKEAQQIVESKFLWKKFIDGTPLANDIACWMADFAQQYTHPPQRTEQEEFKPDWDAMAVMVEEQQRMAKRILELEALLERQTARIVDLQTHIENFDGEDR